MEYLSTSEASKKWNISRRRITLLATEGRINGAIRIGSRWMIPSNVEKPVDGRKKPIVTLDENSYKSFRFRIYDYRPNDNFDPPLTKEEVLLRKDARIFFSCKFSEYESMLDELPVSSENIYIRIYSLYVTCMVCLFLNKIVTFQESYKKLIDEFSVEFPCRSEMLLFLSELNIYVGLHGDSNYTFAFDPKHSYHSDIMSHLSAYQTMSCFYSGAYANSSMNISAFELTCSILEKENAPAIDLQTMHIYLGLMNEAVGNYYEKEYHLTRAYELAEEYDLYWSLAMEYFYYAPSFDPTLKNHSLEFAKKIKKLSITIHSLRAQITNRMSSNSAFEMLPRKSFIYVYYAIQGLDNKQVASLLNVTEKTVKKYYSLIYETLDLKSKKELVNLCKDDMKNMIF